MKKLIFLIIAIIAFTFNANAQTDSIKFTQIISPADSITIGASVTPSIVVKNCGTNTITSIDVTYRIDGGIPVIETLTNIPVNDSVVFTFNQDYTSPVMDYDICFETYNPYGLDTLCKTVIAKTPLNDVGACHIISPVNFYNSAIGINLYPTIQIKNYGLNPQYDIPVEYQIGSLAPVQEVCRSLIAPGDSFNYTFTTPYVVLGTNYQLCFQTRLIDDEISNNNGTCNMIILSTTDNQSTNFTLSQNYPNPTSKSTTITYLSKTAGEATFTVRDIQGKLIYQSEEKAQIGENNIILNTEEFSGGVYYYSLQVDNEVQTKSMQVIQ